MPPLALVYLTYINKLVSACPLTHISAFQLVHLNRDFF